MKQHYSIDVFAMRKYGLNATEWFLLEDIHFRQGITDDGWCDIQRKKLADDHNLALGTLKNLIAKLIEKGMLKRDKNNRLRTSKKWHEVQGHKKVTVGSQKCDDMGHKNVTTQPYKKELRESKRKKLKKESEIFGEIEAKLSEKFSGDPIEMKYPLNREKYQEWIDFRRPKKPVSEKAMQLQVKRLCKYPADIQAAMIDQSIENDYQGLFEIKQQTYKPKGTPEVGSIAWQMEQERKKADAVDVEVL